MSSTAEKTLYLFNRQHAAGDTFFWPAHTANCLIAVFSYLPDAPDIMERAKKESFPCVLLDESDGVNMDTAKILAKLLRDYPRVVCI